MARTGQLQKQRSATLNHMELEHLIEEFGDAMRSAHVPYIAERGQLTTKMYDVWMRYVEWSQKQ